MNSPTPLSVNTTILNYQTQSTTTVETQTSISVTPERNREEQNENNCSFRLKLAEQLLSNEQIMCNNNNSIFSSNILMPSKLEYLLDLKPCDHETAALHGWNPDDRSLNVFVKESDPFTLHRHPVAQSTDCIRTKVGYTKGIHLWEISWNSKQRGTHAIIGVASDKSPLHCVGYQCLIGSNNESYGWDLGRNRVCHNLKSSGLPPPIYPRSNLKCDDSFQIPDKFKMCLDMDDGTLSFIVDGHYLGVAFSGLRGKKLHPIVSVVWGHAEVTMRYVNGLDSKYLNLSL
jgi:SPRY domain-containing SOCS box protein 1/4